jgi:excisionase family DNA binding protein
MPTQRPETREAFENILRLRRAARIADPQLRAEIVPVLEFLEDIAGQTVRPADAARLLGISQPALKRWLDGGKISAVTTPRGRREIPLSELLDLLEEVEEEVRDEPGGRPITRVIRERERRADESVDLQRLIPRRSRRSHRTAELQALAYHRLIAERLDDEVVEEARARLRRWHREGHIDPRWFDQWEHVLALPLPQIKKAIGADTKRARELRQTSPFAGMLTEQERQRLVKAVEDRASA